MEGNTFVPDLNAGNQGADDAALFVRGQLWPGSRQLCRLREQFTGLLGGSCGTERIEHCCAVGKQRAHPVGDDLLHFRSRDPIRGGSLAPSFRYQRPGDVIAITLAPLHRMRWAHAMAKTVEDQANQQTRLLCRTS